MVIYHLLTHILCVSANKYAGVAELADALDLGSSVPDVQVQVLSPALIIGEEVRMGLLFLYIFLKSESLDEKSYKYYYKRKGYVDFRKN